MLVFNGPTAKPSVVAKPSVGLSGPADKEPCRCFACSHRRANVSSPRRAALMSWRRLAETLRPGTRG